MITNDLYSIIVHGDMQKVDAIFKKHKVKYRADDFYPGKGYVFIVQEEGIGSHPLIDELYECEDADSPHFAYVVSSESV